VFRRALVVLALMLCTAVVAPAGSAKDPVTFADATGDAQGIPDLASISIEDNGAGGLVVTIVLATMPDLQPDGLVYLFVDTDVNAATGNDLGAEVMVILDATGIGMLRWDGTQMAPVAPPADAQLTGMGVQFTLARTDVGERFRLAVVSTTQSPTSGIDIMPNDGEGLYPATIVRLENPATTISVRRGAVLDVRSRKVVLSSGATVQAQMRCTLRNRGKVVKALAGGCRWRIARTLGGRRLTLTVVFTYGGQTKTQAFVVNVRR